MKQGYFVLLLAAAMIGGLGYDLPSASATVPCDPYMQPVRRAKFHNWNAPYYHVSYGAPVALVVPPTANLQTDWSWGVASSRISRIDHQFHRNWPGPGPWGGPFLPTPVWPQDTTQFGVYYVRGPW